MPDLSVVWRDWGHRLTSGDDLLQFEVADRTQVHYDLVVAVGRNLLPVENHCWKLTLKP